MASGAGLGLSLEWSREPLTGVSGILCPAGLKDRGGRGAPELYNFKRFMYGILISLSMCMPAPEHVITKGPNWYALLEK